MRLTGRIFLNMNKIRFPIRLNGVFRASRGKSIICRRSLWNTLWNGTINLNSAGILSYVARRKLCSLLTKLAFKEIEFDKSFVEELGSNAQSCIVMKNVMQICKELPGTQSLADRLSCCVNINVSMGRVIISQSPCRRKNYWNC